MSLPALLASSDMSNFTLVIRTSTGLHREPNRPRSRLAILHRWLYRGMAVHAVEDPKPIDDFRVLPMVQDFKLRANQIRHQLLRVEVDHSADEAESKCERRGQKSSGARHSGTYCHR